MGESKKRKEGKFPIKEKVKKKRKKIPNQRMGESKKKEGKKVLDQRTRRSVQKGLLTGQYLNNTELSPNETKNEGKETTT